MSDIKEKQKETLPCGCHSPMFGLQYEISFGVYNDPYTYDGISEWHCEGCGKRFGRWTLKELKGDERELRYGGKE